MRRRDKDEVRGHAAGLQTVWALLVIMYYMQSEEGNVSRVLCGGGPQRVDCARAGRASLDGAR
eukprot:6695128-Pyramimonas_sp.AAC.1